MGFIRYVIGKLVSASAIVLGFLLFSTGALGYSMYNMGVIPAIMTSGVGIILILYYGYRAGW